MTTQALREMFPAVPAHEWHRGACGIGFLANSDGVATRDVVTQAVEACGCLTHRGAETRRDANDAGTSDGAGIMFSLHAPFYAGAFEIPLSTEPHPFAIGMLFLPQAEPEAQAARRLVERVLALGGAPVAAWRAVPVRRDLLGAHAAETCPTVAQILVRRPARWTVEQFEGRLFYLRKIIERRAHAQGLPLYIPSLSARTVVYKGLFRATQVQQFYQADIGSESFLASVAVYHQRYATNTLPDWSLAQPMRRLCHNGEINTLLGNRTWIAAREHALAPRARRRLVPVLGEGSDSAQLDQAMEAITASGVPAVHALLGLVPEAHEATPEMHEQMRAWYRLQQAIREPWDGPAGLIYYDGRWVMAHLDRNGLRPLFVQETTGSTGPRQVIVASEQGVTEWPGEDVIYSGQLGPGEMIALDLESGRCYHDKEIKAELVALQSDWKSVAERHIQAGGTDFSLPPLVEAEALTRIQVAAGATLDDHTYFMLPMVCEGREPVWSMGDDSQLTPYVDRARMLEDHLRQRFAQVTNPPIDPYREALVFNTKVYLGKLEGFFGEPMAGRCIELDSPVLGGGSFSWLLRQDGVRLLSLAFPLPADGKWFVDAAMAAFERALACLEAEAVKAVREGSRVLVLSDRRHHDALAPASGGHPPVGAWHALEPAVDADHAAIPVLLAVARVHERLSREGLRTRVGLVSDVAGAWQDHHLACQLGFGVDAVHPWMALEWAQRIAQSRKLTPDPEGERFRKLLHRSVVKVMSKMGICSAASYTGARLFEILGLDDDVLDRFFPGAAHWGQGVSLRDLVDDVLSAHHAAFADLRGVPGAPPRLEDAGFVRYRKGGIHRAYLPDTFAGLHKVVEDTPCEEGAWDCLEGADPREFSQGFAQAIETDSRDAYASWARSVNGREPVTASDRYELVSDRDPIPLEEVEPICEILDDRQGKGRVCGGAMSWGALGEEAHVDIAVAMNCLGARSNSGEGGERESRFGTIANSETKQVASARFGVTPQYLFHLSEWQIKMAQGSKPGEGGQLPGHKVSKEIGMVRGADAGVSLISPPPHHDIYSIEDLAELIHELGQFNPRARSNVKLVSETGVGIVASGVAKGGVHTIHVSGHAGGTGASPLSSIKFAGLPWELGIQMAHQVMHANDLRSRVKLVVDGGFQTGEQAVKAFVLGAEAVALGTVLLIAEGCVMARQCHLNTCPAGIATQSRKHRANYKGKPVRVGKFLVLFAEEIRAVLARLGYRSVDEIVGHSHLLRPRSGLAEATRRISFDRELLGRPLPLGEHHPIPVEVSPLNRRLLRDAQPALGPSRVRPATLRYSVRNTDRAVGATLAGEIVAATGSEGLKQPVDIHLYGNAGQSLGFGAWGGMRLVLTGRANDYVGKAMGRGGLIAVRPPRDLGCPPESAALVGNAVGYGATGGKLFVNGRAGQRFMCRNSGAEAVVEGVGPHGCEYMTRGTVVVLGPVGLNFGAGMTGGAAYLLNAFTAEERGRLNTDYVRAVPLSEEERSEGGFLHLLITEHLRWTGSPLAETILRYWEFYARYRLDKVVSIVPRAVLEDDEPGRPADVPVTR